MGRAMSAQVASDPRLAFFEMPSTPTPAPRAASRPASNQGPAAHHRLHGAIAYMEKAELRITSQPRRAVEIPGRIVIRRWYRRNDGTWWPDAGKPGIEIRAENAAAFLAAVQAACSALEAGNDERGGP
jgi:hypothetical protein